MDSNTVIAISAAVSAIATIVIACLTRNMATLADRSLRMSAELATMSERLNWFTGALESHSSLMLRIEAARGINGKPIEAIWWDPTLEKAPVKREHGKAAQLERIYVFVPMEERQNIEKRSG